MHRRLTTATPWLPFAVVFALLASGCASVAARAAGPGSVAAKRSEDRPPAAAAKQDLPYRGYLDAHATDHPPVLLGGPIHVTVTQTRSGVFVALPDKRRLDPFVFGTPERPRAFAGTPGITGLPLQARAVASGHYTQAKVRSPFGDKFVVLPDGELQLDAIDATATDGRTSDDRVRFRAIWHDRDGNTYEVRCCERLATHGLEFPTFGGVLTNHILHGSSRLGTPLMPTEFTFVAFWGMGSIWKNGKVVAKPRLVHGMLTEYVRTRGYRLADDAHVTPGRVQFHLMVPPFRPDPRTGRFEASPVPTGFTLPNGRELPFWHVMFENLEIEASRG